jgi:hypothetical protein
MTRAVRSGLIDYRIADGDPAPADLRWWAVLRTRAVDELTGEPPLNRICVSTTTPGCLPRVGDNGLCGLVARPRAVSSQMLARGGFTAEIRADGYLPRSLTAAIDAARRTTTGAMPGDAQLTIAPPEPTPPAPRRQFLPGRGVLLETPLANQPHSFTATADPLAAPAPNVVPLADPVAEPRPGPGPWRVAGVPMVLPDQPLHRAEPAVVRGRARRQPSALAQPVDAPGASIGLTGVWWTFGEIPANSTPPHLPDFVACAAPLAFDRPVGTLERLIARTPDGVPRALVSPARAGTAEIELADVGGLAAGGGDTIELEAANCAEREIAITVGFTPPPAGVTRAVVRLTAPLAFPHAAGAPAVRAALVFGALGALAREAQRGDRVLFASTLAGVPASDVLRIAGGGAPAELRAVRRFPLYDAGSTTFSFPPALAADGSFILPPIARVAQIQLFVAHAGQVVHAPIDLVPDYRSDTTLQILFKP